MVRLKRTLVILITILIIISFISAGCNKGEENTIINIETTVLKSDETYNDFENKVIYSFLDEPEMLDPSMNIFSRSSRVLQNLFKGLYKFDENGNGMAEKFELDSSGTIYTFTLKDNLKWSNAESLTAYDFEYAFKRVLNPNNKSATAFSLYYIKNGKDYNLGLKSEDELGIDVIDEKTISS